jgi:FAD/FMN-containing dehydrogenase
MSWNQGVWGYGNESVEAVELVTAEGKLITANEHDHSDYFWAARSAGYGFFGVVTCYHLKLYPLPKAITASPTTTRCATRRLSPSGSGILLPSYRRLSS